MLKLLPFCIFTAFTAVAEAQSIFSFRFLQKDNTASKALLVIQPDGTGFMRYRIGNAIAEQKLEEQASAPQSPEEAEESLTYEATANSFIKGSGTLSSFDLLMKTVNNELVPAALTMNNAGAKTATSLDSVSFLNNAQLTRSFLQDYFLPTEPFFVQLFNNNTKALSPLEKNTRIHLMIVANTNDSTVGVAAVKDIKTVEDFFSDLTEVMGIKTMNTVKVYGNNFSRGNVLDALKKIAPQPNDIVVFYYSGHGFRTSAKATPYPMYDLRSRPGQDYVKESLTTDTVAQLLKAKNARMTLVLSDCCNWNPDMPLPYVKADPQTRSTDIPWDIDKCRALFLNPKKTAIIGVAADKNQLAVSNAEQGSFFFKYFRESLVTVINKTYRSFNTFMDWNYIAESTRAQTNRKSKKTYCSKPYIPANICNQTPRFLIQ